MTEDHITPEHLDATLETFRGRVYRASMERAIAEVRAGGAGSRRPGTWISRPSPRTSVSWKLCSRQTTLDAAAVGQL